MSQPNPPGNPNAAEQSKLTGFGSANNDPIAAAMKARPWSIRNAIRYWAAQGIDITDPAKLEELKKERKATLTTGQLIGLIAVQKALNGEDKSVEFVTENIEGKLPQTTINADLEKVKGLNDDELRSFIATGLAAGATAAVGDGDNGGQAPGHLAPAAAPAAAAGADPQAAAPVDAQKI